MPLRTHQTVRLGKGKHRSAAEGACVMELASMLAGESFTDHPVSVCPVIGGFLRAYNDSLDDARRQDLYAYASMIVGSKASAAVEDARAARLVEWTLSVRRRRRRWSLVPRRIQALSYGVPVEGAGARAAREAVQDGGHSHAEALALIDELLALGATEPTAAAAVEEALTAPVIATS